MRHKKYSNRQLRRQERANKETIAADTSMFDEVAPIRKRARPGCEHERPVPFADWVASKLREGGK